MVPKAREERQTAGNRIPWRFGPVDTHEMGSAIYGFQAVVSARVAHYSEGVTGGHDCGVACALTDWRS